MDPVIYVDIYLFICVYTLYLDFTNISSTYVDKCPKKPLLRKILRLELESLWEFSNFQDFPETRKHVFI